MKRFITAATLICLLSGVIRAQNPQTVDLQFASQETKTIGPSPQAAEMTRYADTPVSYGLGLAQISIPLYEVHSRSISLPVSLSYNSAGVRVDEISGPVGLNWSLEAGGVITRAVVGRPDEDIGGWDDTKYIYSTSSPLDVLATWEEYEKIASGEYDSERDLYSYSFCGYSGSFYLVRNSSGLTEVIPTSATDLNIRYLGGVFFITDPSGNKYLFSETETTTSFTRMGLPILGAESGSAETYPQQVVPVTAWYLKQIISIDSKDSITFIYEQPPYFFTESNAYVRSYSFTYKYLGPNNYSWLDQYGQWGGNAPEVSGQLGSYETTRGWTPHLVKCIKWNGGSVSFTYDNSPAQTGILSFPRRSYPKVLIEMSVWDVPVGGNDSTLVRRASFSHVATNDQRTLLRSVSLNGANNYNIESYSMGYISESTNMISDAKDLFGYYNGKTTNSYLAFLRLFEDNYTFQQETVADRSYNSTAVHALSLETITTGSGSKTKFIYGSNSVPTSGSGALFSAIGIGQCISSILTYDLSAGGETLIRTRSFTYSNPQLTIPAAYFDRRAFATVSESFREDLLSGHGWWNSDYNPIPRTCYVTFADQSVLPGVPLERAQIFYGEVTEVVSGPGTGESVRTEYEYDVSGAALSASNGQWSLGSNHDSHDNSRNSYGSHSYHFFERPPYQIPRDSGLGPSIYFEPIRFHFIPEDRPQMTAPIEVRSYKRLAGSGTYELVNTTHNTYAKTTENLRIGWRVRSMIAKGDEQCVLDTLCAIDFFKEEIVQRRVWHRLTNTTVTEYLDGNNSNVVFSTDYTYMQYSSGGNETVPATGSILTPTLTTITVNGEQSPRYARNNTYASGIAADSTWAASLANMGYRLPVGETVIAMATGSSASVAQKRQTWKAFPISTWTNGTGSGSGSTMWEPYQSFIFRDGVKVGPSTYYTIYDGHGNPIEIRQEGQPVKTYVWGYGGLRPVAEIVGAGFNAVRSALTSSQRSILNGITTSSAIDTTQLTFLRTTLRNALPGAMISVYTYNGPEYAMSLAEDPSGRKIYYSYDDAGHLASVMDEDGNLMEGYLYELTRGVQGLPNRILSLSYTAPGATSLPNSIASALSSLSSLPVMKDVAYLDGLGRAVQSVSVGASTNGRDLVTPAIADFLDREDARAYLPYPATTSSANVGSFRSGAVSAQQTYYNGQYGSGTKAYAENVYEMSSRNRVKESSLPGFSERTVISTEGSPDDYLLKLSFNATNQTISASGYYDEDWFVINRTEGPDGSIIESWNDEFGTPVLERVRIEAATSSSPEKWAETRYIKDARGRVLCVIPPAQYESLSTIAAQNGGVVNSFSAGHCYTYQYDGRDRIIKRHLPDQVTETLTYNDADLVISTVRIAADGNGTETFTTEYDTFNRPLRERYKYGNGSTITLIEYVYDSYPSTMGTGNSAQSVPTFSSVSGIATSSDKDPRTKGLKTAERVRILPPGESESSMTADGNAQFIVRSFYYDKKGNVIQTAEARQDVGTTSRFSTKYGFTGKALQSRETVDLPAAGGGSALTTHLDKSFSYDSRVRLTNQTAQLTSGGTVGQQDTLVFRYDELGRTDMLRQGIGSAADSTFYSYTIQGWLASADGKTYSETLRYQNPSKTGTNGLPGKAGLITEWTTLQKGTTADGGTTVSDTYAYEYDGAGRLTGSTRYSGSSSTALTTLTEKGITYDESGNLLTIKRYDASSATTPVDDLNFTYTGTKRTGYTYDAHANVTADPTSGTTLAWNVIGLPRTISDNTNTARRVYAADGTLLAVYEGTSGTTGRVYVGSLDILRASNGAFTVESAGWEGGKLLPGTGNDKVLSQITDHLGSVRAVKDGAGNVLQRIDYYPFGSVSTGWSSSTTPAQPTIRYRFSGKEIAGQSIGASAPAGTSAAAAGNPYLDFGARLYDPRTASWLSHDLLAEKYYSISSFAYCSGNPISIIDKNGLDLVLFGANNSSVTFTTTLLDFSIDVSGLGIDWKGNFSLDGKETLSAALDLAGFLDPTGIADGANAVLLASGGDYWGAILSGLSVLPLGDLAKLPKLSEDVRVINDAIGLTKKGYLRRPYIRKWVRETVEEKAARDPLGRFLDANEGSLIEGKYDLGHVKGKEFWRMKKDAEAKGMSQKEFNELMNDPDLYQVEDPHINRSRKHEQKD